ncbi:MAG: hypothetical protein WEC75_05675 [Dehalococcoidia bacterium]
MDRTDAYRTLRLDPSADGQMVADAYWRLVRKAQTRRDAAARDEIEQLNAAYGALSTDAQRVPVPPSSEQAATFTGSGLPFLDAFADWVAAEAQRTRLRWAGRNPEIALIGGAAIVMMFAALGAGASLLLVFGSVAVILAVIWSPWRKPE